MRTAIEPVSASIPDIAVERRRGLNTPLTFKLADNKQAPSARLLSVSMIQAPLVRQAFDFDCGCACIQSALRMYGYDVRSGLVIDALEMSSDELIDCHRICDMLAIFGVKAEERENLGMKALRSHLLDSRPVMTAVQAWGTPDHYSRLESGHFVLCLGMDSVCVYFMDPSLLGVYGFLPIDVFERRWRDMDKYGKRVNQYSIVFPTVDMGSGSVFKRRRARHLFARTE